MKQWCVSLAKAGKFESQQEDMIFFSCTGCKNHIIPFSWLLWHRSNCERNSWQVTMSPNKLTPCRSLAVAIYRHEGLTVVRSEEALGSRSPVKKIIIVPVNAPLLLSQNPKRPHSKFVSSFGFSSHVYCFYLHYYFHCYHYCTIYLFILFTLLLSSSLLLDYISCG